MQTNTLRTGLLLILAVTLTDATGGQSPEIGPAPRLWELRAIETLILREEYDIAVNAARELARQTEQLHGPKYLGLADIHGLLGTALRKQGRLPEARIAIEKMLELRKHSLGELAGLSIIALRELAGLHREAGRLDDARKLAEHAKDLVERIPPYETLEATILVELAQVLTAQKNDASARPLLVRALSLQEKSLGGGSAVTNQTMRLLVELHERGGHQEQAESLRKRLTEEPVDPTPRCLFVVPALQTVADMYRRGGDMQTPVELARRSLKVAEEDLGPEDPSTVAVREDLAVIEAAARAAPGKPAAPGAPEGARP